jgi:hypothetical protein
MIMGGVQDRCNRLGSTFFKERPVTYDTSLCARKVQRLDYELIHDSILRTRSPLKGRYSEGDASQAITNQSNGKSESMMITL